MAYTYSLLASTTVGAGGTSAITFSNIPQNYTDLIVKVSLRTNYAAVFDSVLVAFNGSSSSYSARIVYGDGSTATSTSATNGISWLYAAGANATASTFSNDDMYIPNYSNGSINKSLSIDAVGENNATSSIAGLTAGLWSNVTAISSIKLTPGNGTSFSQYSTVSIYGVRSGEY